MAKNTVVVHLVKTFQVNLYTVLYSVLHCFFYIVHVTYTAVQSACNDVKCNSVYCLVYRVFSYAIKQSVVQSRYQNHK